MTRRDSRLPSLPPYANIQQLEAKSEMASYSAALALGKLGWHTTQLAALHFIPCRCWRCWFATNISRKLSLCTRWLCNSVLVAFLCRKSIATELKRLESIGSRSLDHDGATGTRGYARLMHAKANIVLRIWFLDFLLKLNYSRNYFVTSGIGLVRHTHHLFLGTCIIATLPKHFAWIVSLLSWFWKWWTILILV